LEINVKIPFRVDFKYGFVNSSSGHHSVYMVLWDYHWWHRPRKRYTALVNVSPTKSKET